MDMMNLEENPEFGTAWMNIEQAQNNNQGNLAMETLEGWIEYYTEKLEKMEDEREKVSELGKYYMDAQINDMKENIAGLKKAFKEMTE